MDVKLFHFLNDAISNSFLDQFMPIVSNKFTWIPLYLLFVIIAVLQFKKQSWKPIVAILVTFLVTELTCNLLKNSLKRKRPNNIESVMAIKRVEGGSGYSTPSAHAANHMAIAVVVCLLFRMHWFWKILIYCWAILIGFSRIYNGVHFPSDVLIGFGLGGVLALLVFWLYSKYLKPLSSISKEL